MALHTQLPISKVTYDLSLLAAELVRNMPRDFKRLHGERLMSECLDISMCVYRANVRYLHPTGSTCAVGCTTRPAKSKDCPNWKRAPGGQERRKA